MTLYKNDEPVLSLQMAVAPTLEIVESTDYTWQRADSVAEIEQYHACRKKVDNVIVAPPRSRHRPINWGALLGGWGNVIGVNEAYRYSDGSLLVCITLSEFVGTECPSEDVVRFYFATPK